MLSNKTLLLLISLAVLSNCSGFLAQDPPLSRQIPLLHDIFGFYVESAFLSQEGSPKALMAISITGSQALFGDCWGFSQLVCESSFGCSISSEKELYEFPYVSAPSSQLSAQTDQDPSFWSLTGRKIHGTNCTGSMCIPLYGTNRLGVIGMGIKHYPWGSNSFTKSFSFSFSEDLEEGTLYLGPRPDPPATPATTLKTDQDWITSYSQSTVAIGSKKIPFTGRLLFDISYEAIGFTTRIFKNLMLALRESVPGLICTPLSYMPFCAYSGKISNLPSIVIGGGNQESLTIPPEVYARYGYDIITPTIVLNIKEIGPKFSGPRFINPAILGDTDMIILDPKFLNYSSAEFEFPSPDQTRIKLYKPNKHPFMHN